MESQGLENRLDIGLGSAGDADMEVWEFGVDEVHQGKPQSLSEV